MRHGSERHRRLLWRAATATAVSAAVLLTGCPRGSGQQDLGSLPTVTTTDEEAEADLRQAQRAVEQGRTAEASEGFREFLREHPTDPLVPLAQLGLGRISLADGEVEEALERFRAVAGSEDPAVAEVGRFYEGVALHLDGRHRQAIERLSPLVGRLTDPDDSALLLRTLAAAAQRTGQTVLALESLDRLARSEALGEEARAGAVEDIRTLVDQTEPEAIARAYDELARDGAAWPEVAVRAIRIAFDAGDMARVSAIVGELRQREIPMSEELAELAVRAERTERADPRVIGAIVPLTGPGREVGQRAVRGLMLAAGAPSSGPPGPTTPQLVVRDDGGDPARAAAAVEDLVSEHRAIAIVGPLEGAAARAAARRAQELGVPMIALTPDPSVTSAGPMAFRLFPGPLDEARALVQAARARSARRFAILRPDHAYGRRMSEAFARAVRAAGGEVVATESYPPGSTAFGEVVSRLAGRSFDALFVPDGARQLNLVAPALASAGLWSVPAGQGAPRGSRAITLLAPSVALDARALAGSSRYMQGALFAASFSAAAPSAAGRSFVQTFEQRFHQPPDTFAAHAYDAFNLVRAAVAAGHQTRDAVARWLREQGGASTVTATGGLSAERQPARPSAVLEMRGTSFAPPASPGAT